MLILMSGPWGWMGYEIEGGGEDLAALAARAHDEVIVKNGWRGSIEVVPEKDPDLSEQDGQWTVVSEEAMRAALLGEIADPGGESMILHG